MKRLSEMSHNEMRKIRDRQRKGTMSELYDKQNYLCFDEREYAEWKPKKNGRKPKELHKRGK